MNLVNCALIIPTRNRSHELSKTLSHISTFLSSSLPRTIIISDSSGDTLTQDVVATFSKKLDAVDFRYLRAEYGSPHQKNVAIAELLNASGREYDFISFLDDDIEPNPDYFRAINRLFKLHGECICLGGFDRDLAAPKLMFLREVFGLDRKRGGVVLRSGLAIAPRPVEEYQPCMWTPGGMQSIRWGAIKSSTFDGKVRIHGDEVELQLRLRNYGIIACSSLLDVRHRQGQGGKQNVEETTLFLDGFRWRLSKQFPDVVSWVAVLLVTAQMIVFELLFALFTWNGVRVSRAKGHAMFFARLCRGLETQDLVDHRASGTHVSTLNWRPWL